MMHHHECLAWTHVVSSIFARATTEATIQIVLNHKSYCCLGSTRRYHFLLLDFFDLLVLDFHIPGFQIGSGVAAGRTFRSQPANRHRLWKFGIPKIQRIEILKFKICSAQNVGKVLIRRKNTSCPFGANYVNLSWADWIFTLLCLVGR